MLALLGTLDANTNRAENRPVLSVQLAVSLPNPGTTRSGCGVFPSETLDEPATIFVPGASAPRLAERTAWLFVVTALTVLPHAAGHIANTNDPDAINSRFTPQSPFEPYGYTPCGR